MYNLCKRSLNTSHSLNVNYLINMYASAESAVCLCSASAQVFLIGLISLNKELPLFTVDVPKIVIVKKNNFDFTIVTCSQTGLF